jgi:hypothetical protein
MGASRGVSRVPLLCRVLDSKVRLEPGTSVLTEFQVADRTAKKQQR